MKYGGYEFATLEDGHSPSMYATPKQKAELKALADRLVVYPGTDYNDVICWSVGHCADVLTDGSNPPYLFVKIKDVTPQSIAYGMRRELYKERERLNRALAFIQPTAINFPLKYPKAELGYSLKLNPKYNNTVRFAQYRLVLVFFGAIYLGCVLVFSLEIVVHKMAHGVRMWHTLGTTRLFH